MNTRRHKKPTRTSDTVRVIGYIRVSTADQANSGLGLESQRQKIAADCARRGWELLTIIEDAGASGKGIARKGLQEALDALKGGNAEVLMSAKLDRLSRSVKDVCQIGDMAKFYGWNLVLLDCNIDTTTPYGTAQLNMMATFAQLERELIGLPTKEALAVKKAQGIRLGRPVLMSAETEAKVLDLRAKGLSMAKIADQLNSDQMATVNGGLWYASTIKVVLDRAA
ncbi:MAG: recombinase family protein [Armatimonadota bacterium]